jgi:hypothetical protein
VANAEAITCYELSSCFEGFKTTAERLQAAAAKGKLTKRDNGTFSLHVHSNLWFEFKAAQ